MSTRKCDKCGAGICQWCGKAGCSPCKPQCDKARIEALEKQVEELKQRQAAQPIVIPQPYPVPYYPYNPVYPYNPIGINPTWIVTYDGTADNVYKQNINTAAAIDIHAYKPLSIASGND